MLSRKSLRLILSVLVSLGLLAYVFRGVELGQLLQVLKQARWSLIVLFWIIAIFALWLVAYRHTVILKYQKCPTSIITVFRASMIAALYNLVLPGGFSQGVKWYVLKKHTGKGAQVLASMFYNQLTTHVVSLGVGLVALAVENPWPDLPLPFIAAVLLIALMGGAVFLFSPFFENLTKWWLRSPWMSHILPKAGQQKLILVSSQVGMFRSLGWVFHAKVFMLCLVSRGVAVLAYLSAARAIEAEFSVGAIVWITSAIGVLALIPFFFQNTGPREVLLVTAAGMYGVLPEKALTLSLVFVSVRLVQAAGGALFQIRWRHHEPSHT
ncbi:lysylphosphatidylglycerol synthase transmembrane domain-containing protein [Planctomycetota bacterium]